MLSSHTPLRRAQRTRPSRASYYRVGAVNSSARSVSSRRLNSGWCPQAVAHRDNPTWLPLRSSGRTLEGFTHQLRFHVTAPRSRSRR
jgi:hypothetical protein